MRQFLKEQSAPLEEALHRTKALLALAQETLTTRDRAQATVLAARASEVRLVGEKLRPPAPPSRLGDLEDRWRVYRDGYQELLEDLQSLASATAEVEATLEGESPAEVLRRRFNDVQRVLNDQLEGYGATIDDRMQALRAVWRVKQREDALELGRRCGHVLETAVSTSNLLGLMNLVDGTRAELVDAFAGRYPSFLNTLEQLVEGIDLEGAYSITEDDRLELEEQLKDLRAVAQVGVTVEIIGHEFEALEGEVRRNLAKLPADVRKSDAFIQALRSHQALADRLRFLSPMKIGGYRARERITGEQIAAYIEEFFGRAFRDQRIDFVATQAFRSIAITDLPSRIHPVFLNLVNNAIYWVSQAAERKIRIDLVDGLVVVADTGPGVDPEDVERLFELFFTRRRSGRGVGLYLSRVNLAVAGHKIRYANSLDPQVLDGANFVIEFKGVAGNA
jgi:signal transduction histidine kinase